MNQLPGWLRSRDVNRFPLWLEVCPGYLQADQMVHALTGSGFRTIKGFGNLIHFSRGTENHPQREPEAFALLRVPADYRHFPFLVPKPIPLTPSRSALRLPVDSSGLPSRLRLSVPRPCCPSGVVHPSSLDPPVAYPTGFSAHRGARELVDENGLQSFSGYKEKKKIL